jgi:hypothetical protein
MLASKVQKLPIDVNPVAFTIGSDLVPFGTFYSSLYAFISLKSTSFYVQ